MFTHWRGLEMVLVSKQTNKQTGIESVLLPSTRTPVFYWWTLGAPTNTVFNHSECSHASHAVWAVATLILDHIFQQRCVLHDPRTCCQAVLFNKRTQPCIVSLFKLLIKDFKLTSSLALWLHRLPSSLHGFMCISSVVSSSSSSSQPYTKGKLRWNINI